MDRIRQDRVMAQHEDLEIQGNHKVLKTNTFIQR